MSSRTWTIVKREFLAAVRTKGFLLGTLFGPAIFAAWIILPAVFADSGGTREIVVIDGTRSGLGQAVADQLVRDSDDLAFHARVVAPSAGASDSVREAMASRAAATSASRPTSGVGWAGRLCRLRSSDLIGGNSDGNPGATTWKTCSGCSRSLSR